MYFFALGEIVFGDADVDAAAVLVRAVDTGFLFQLHREVVPQHRRLAAPALIFGHAQALALHPHQSEVAARGAECDIAFVEQRDLEAAPREPVGDRRADEPAAYDYAVVAGHAEAEELRA